MDEGGTAVRLRTARSLLRTILERAQADPAYRERLREDPAEFLLREGLPYDVIEDFLGEAGVQGEVTGYGVRSCANTCALTNAAGYPANIQEFIRHPE